MQTWCRKCWLLSERSHKGIVAVIGRLLIRTVNCNKGSSMMMNGASTKCTLTYKKKQPRPKKKKRSAKERSKNEGHFGRMMTAQKEVASAIRRLGEDGSAMNEGITVLSAVL